MIAALLREDAADAMRELAASYRRLARRAPTLAGAAALKGVADQFDTDARRTNPLSIR